jgi:plasmid maintenance system antidote protein VapI|tara:strand:- start:177 stop:392 length:216 start_codon:yes stop_codon:yes gene_type:complete
MMPFKILELRKSIKNSGLMQKDVAKIIGVNVIHLNKVLNNKASLTQNMARKLSKIKLLDSTEQQILYPLKK